MTSPILALPSIILEKSAKKKVISPVKSDAMKKNVREFNHCHDILEKGVNLLHEKSGYSQITLINKLRTLNCIVSPAWMTVMLKYKKGGLPTLKKASAGIASIIRQELDQQYDPHVQNYTDAQTLNWRAQIVAETPEPAFRIAFYQEGRVSVQEKINFILPAQQEVIEVGVRLNSFSNYFITQNEGAYKTHVENLLQNGVNIKGYLIDPDSQEARMYFEDRARAQPFEKDSVGDIKKTIQRLRLIAEELNAAPVAGKFEIYQYKHIPCGFFLVVDPAMESGKMMFSPYLYAVRRANCPVITFRKQDQPFLFKRYWESLLHFTKNAKKLI